MPQYITDCPRCGIKHTTFDMLSFAPIKNSVSGCRGEVFSVCRNCHQSTVFIMSPRTIDLPTAFSDRYTYSESVVNEHLDLHGFIGLKDLVENPPVRFEFTDGRCLDLEELRINDTVSITCDNDIPNEYETQKLLDAWLRSQVTALENPEGVHGGDEK